MRKAAIPMICAMPGNLNTASLRPPLKWAGGKRCLVPHLLPLWEPFSNRRLVEPFCGGLAVALGLIPESALRNDRNSHLLNCYGYLKRTQEVERPMEKEAFGWDEQVRAAEWLAQHKGPCILCNQATKRILNLYGRLGFKLRFLDAPRRISCTGDRTPAKEVLAMRNLG